MSKADKNYFRHSVNARLDPFMIGLINEFGEKGYFMWFALLEVCAEMILDGHSQPITFDQSRLFRELRCSGKTLFAFLNYCQSGSKVDPKQVEGTSKVYSTYIEGTSKVHFTYLQPTLKIEVPNLSKYLGDYIKLGAQYKDKYKDKNNNKDKNKDNRNDEKKSLPFRLDDLIQLWNDTLARKAGRIEFCNGLSSGEVEKLEVSAGYPELSTLEGWKVLFEKIKANKFYTGMEPGKDFVVTLNWLVNPEKCRGIMAKPSTGATPENKTSGQPAGKWNKKLAEINQQKAV